MLHTEENPCQVDGQRPLSVLQVDVFRGCGAAIVVGVVESAAQLAEVAFHSGQQGCHLDFVADIDGLEVGVLALVAQVLDQGCSDGVAPVYQQQAGAFSGEKARSGGTDTAAGTGDQGGLVEEQGSHGFAFLFRSSRARRRR